jgi:hypothetical protein
MYVLLVRSQLARDWVLNLYHCLGKLALTENMLKSFLSGALHTFRHFSVSLGNELNLINRLGTAMCNDTFWHSLSFNAFYCLWILSVFTYFILELLLFKWGTIKSNFSINRNFKGYSPYSFLLHHIPYNLA